MTETGFAVEDDGSGILNGEGERIFESGPPTAEDGIGFGPTTVKQMTDAHG